MFVVLLFVVCSRFQKFEIASPTGVQSKAHKKIIFIMDVFLGRCQMNMW